MYSLLMIHCKLSHTNHKSIIAAEEVKIKGKGDKGINSLRPGKGITELYISPKMNVVSVYDSI